jgi:bifunctional aspartokinase / homoserine dehydrogenase 1
MSSEHAMRQAHEAAELCSRTGHSPRGHRLKLPISECSPGAGQFGAERVQNRPVQGQLHRNLRRQLRIMKFGGTSVGDASCIKKVVEIIRVASDDSDLVVVVSAMAGVTNKLLEAAAQAEAGNSPRFATILNELRAQHETAVDALLSSPDDRSRIRAHMQQFFEEGSRLCQGTLLLRELTPRVRDSISSLGERLCAPLIAAAMQQVGLCSKAIDATEVVVTDSCHGAADPWMDLTRERCEERLGPLLQQGIIPVVTGFIGATPEGVLTTLGRGGSDYSATIVGAALEADEVIIWSDVDGLMTADPRLVPDACTIAEISYREAAELAYFGAKVLHPKTLRAVMHCGIPLRIRNTFTPERKGTKITRGGPLNEEGVTALTAMCDVALIKVGGPGAAGIPDVVGRTFAITTAMHADVLFISHASSQSEVCLVVSAPASKRTVEALRHEFAHDLAHQQVEHITVDSNVAIVTLVGQNIRRASRIIARTFVALSRENVDIVAIAQGSSECNISFVVAQEDVKAAVISTHREFDLGMVNSSALNSQAVV